MATTPRIGSLVLSRVSIPSVFTTTSSRAFSTSIVLRDGPYRNSSDAPDGPALPVRTNPLVGNSATNRTFKRDSVRKSAPPPPPPPSSLLSDIISPDEESKHPYSATRPVDLASIISTKNVNFGQSIDVKPMARPQIRAKPVTGRTVFIKERISVTSAPTPAIAFRMLGKMLREQNVKNKFFLQRFHERKGLKRKRLASLRWRSRFKTGFKHTVNRVLELKRQGW